MNNNPQEWKLSELAKRSNTPARTIRLYISMGLLPGPLRPGRNAAYGMEHLERLERIRTLQREGLTLSQVRETLTPESAGDTPAVPSSSWRHFMPASDVQVLIREDIAPWRARALRQALQQFSRLVNADDETKEQQDGQ